MSKNNKFGFTLVELLATIVILAVILVIAVPKVMSVIEDAKKATLESSAKMVASEAEKRKVQNQVLGKDENITCENVSRLNDIDYKNCYIEFMNNQAYVTIIGSNKFEDMYICKGTKNESKVVDRCPNERVSVTFETNGGDVTDLSGIYKEGDVIELENPLKENATFLNWNVVKGNSTLSDNKLTVGSEDTIVWAEYEEWGELIIDLDGGSVSNNQSGKYKSNTTIELETPIKENYKFIEWEKIEGNGIVSGTTFIMGSLNTKIKAKWELNVFSLRVDANGGTLTKDYNGDYVVGSTIALENPTRTGYIFKEWEIVKGNGIISETTFTIGTMDAELKAIWIPYLTTHITSLLAKETELKNGLIQTNATYNGTTYNSGIRYSGTLSAVKNKVYYNCETTDSAGVSYGSEKYNYASSCEIWRIIGVFDTKTSTSGTAEKRVKLINTSSTFKASYDSSAFAVNFGEGINQWGPVSSYEGADLMRLLNGYYIGVANSTCKYCDDYDQVTCSNTCTAQSLNSAKMKPLTSYAKSMIQNAVWDTYAVHYNLNPVTISNASTAYLQEKGISTQYNGKQCTSGDWCTDNVGRTTSWTGLVGLMSVSDIGYAGSWLYVQDSSGYPWSITPVAASDSLRSCWHARNDHADRKRTSHIYLIYPTVYLKSSVQIIGGDGSENSPYKLSM